VIIDPLSDFCATPGLLAETLHQLNSLADRARIALIVTLPASCRTDAQGRLRVTSRWPTEAARCVWCLVPDPDDPARRLFVAKRTNFCREPQGLAFRLDDGGVAWESDSAISPVDPLGQLSAIEQFLQEALFAGPLLATSVYRLGAERGFSSKQMRSAGNRLGVTSDRLGFGKDGHWWWSLPGHQRPALVTPSVALAPRNVPAEVQIGGDQTQKDERMVIPCLGDAPPLPPASEADGDRADGNRIDYEEPAAEFEQVPAEAGLGSACRKGNIGRNAGSDAIRGARFEVDREAGNLWESLEKPEESLSGT
jgi:hypothetical protein